MLRRGEEPGRVSSATGLTMEGEAPPAGAKAPDSEPKKPEKRTRKRFTRVVVVLVLIACAFGAGTLFGFLRLRSARETWLREKGDMESRLTEVSRELSALRPRDSLWRISESIAAVRIDIAEKNFGLARDAAATAQQIYTQASAALDPDTRAQIAPLGPLLTEVQSAAESVSPQAKDRAQAAADLVHKLLDGGTGSGAPSSGASAGPAAKTGSP